MFNYDEYACKAAEKLNEYDLSDVLKFCIKSRKTEIFDIIKQMKLMYPNLSKEIDILSSEELMEYLQIMYGASFMEETNYYLKPTDFKKKRMSMDKIFQ